MEQKSSLARTLLVVVIGAVVLGSASGYFLSQKVLTGSGNGGVAQQNSQEQVGSAKYNVGDVFGNPDEKTFRDSADGVLLAGGANGEGSYHLAREGGESQTVYLTSSVLDLSQFVNHRVKVWGETFRAQRAGWLMDVGRLQLIELNAELPDWLKSKPETGGNE